MSKVEQVVLVYIFSIYGIAVEREAGQHRDNKQMWSSDRTRQKHPQTSTKCQ